MAASLDDEDAARVLAGYAGGFVDDKEPNRFPLLINVASSAVRLPEK